MSLQPLVANMLTYVQLQSFFWNEVFLRKVLAEKTTLAQTSTT